MRGRALYKEAMRKPKDYLIKPDPLDPRLTERVTGIDQTGAAIETSVTVERALTIFLNSQEIVTAMTIGDYPEYLAIGYLLNQNMLRPDDTITAVDYDEDLAVVGVRTKRKTNYEKKLKKKVQTSGCAQGTVFGDLMEALEEGKLPDADRPRAGQAVYRAGRRKPYRVRSGPRLRRRGKRQAPAQSRGA